MQKKIEGNLQDPVAIIEDVMTTGNSIRTAIDAVKKQGAPVSGVVCVVDRPDPRNAIKDIIQCLSLFTHSEFENFIEQLLSKKINTL